MSQARPVISFFTDNDVADSVGVALMKGGHVVTRLRDAMLTDSPDPIVATACREGGMVLVTHNYRDFRRISSQLQVTSGRFDLLDRIELGCSQVIAARRVAEELILIEHEFIRRGGKPGSGMRIQVRDRSLIFSR